MDYSSYPLGIHISPSFAMPASKSYIWRWIHSSFRLLHLFLLLNFLEYSFFTNLVKDICGCISNHHLIPWLQGIWNHPSFSSLWSSQNLFSRKLIFIQLYENYISWKSNQTEHIYRQYGLLYYHDIEDFSSFWYT